MNEQHSRFTVVLPTHHGERWLAATLESLAAQTHKVFDCILIDSSATGDTIAIAEHFHERLSLKILYRPDLHDWQGKTNLGAKLAEGSYLCMLHQDDIWEPDKAAHIEHWIAETPDAIMHVHPAWIIDDRGRRLGRWRVPLPVRSTIEEQVFLERLIVQNTIAICCPVIAREVFLAVGGLDRDLWYTADWDLYLKLSTVGSVISHSEILAGYRIHASALTSEGSQTPQTLHEQMGLVLDRHIGKIDSIKRVSIEARARASVDVNTAMAGALNGDVSRLAHAALTVLALGPFGMMAFLRDTRLVDRLMPRLRAHAAGRLAPARQNSELQTASRQVRR